MSIIRLYDRIRCCLFCFLLLPAISPAQGKAGDLPFTVDSGVVYSKTGIPELPRWFADSRLAFEMNEEGITQVDYYNPVDGTSLPTLFLRQLWDGFRNFIEKDNHRFKPQYRNTRIWPFGLESEWVVEGAVFQYRLLAVDESIIMQVRTPQKMPAGLHFNLEFFEAFALTRGSDDDLRFTGAENKRTWQPWTFSPGFNSLQGGFTSQPVHPEKIALQSFQTICRIGADFPMKHLVRPINPKQILSSEAMEPGRTYSFCICFGSDSLNLQKKMQALTTNLGKAIRDQYARYRKVAANSPVLKSPYPVLNQFISLAPMYHESLKITDSPGAIRAKSSNYGVWGWDGLTSNYAAAYWGDVEHIRNLLLFYEQTADPQKGIGHRFTNDLKPDSYSTLPAQGMYISLLQLYYANTNDLAFVKERYPFAKIIFDRSAATEAHGTGFCEGSSLFPDFPVAMSETGNDISGFNNTIFYCAARSMESLSALTGDEAERKKALALIGRMEQNYIPLFFNRQKGFVVSSVDSKTLQQRDSYNTNSIRWDNNYCADLTDSIDEACLQFFKKNSVTPMGLREIPVWNKSYDMDANQLHCWWPATGEYFMHVINARDQRLLIEQWIKWVSYWTKHLTCPEGISYYIETDEPEFDRWTSQKGTWQGYSMRGWYQAALHGVVGVGTDAGGIVFYPYSGAEMKLEGLNFMNRKFDIEMKGSGPYIDSIDVDGAMIKATNKVPVDLYADKQRIKIRVYRSALNRYPFYIKAGTGIEMRHYRHDEKGIQAILSGAGFCRLKLRAARMPVIKVSGKKVPVRYDPQQQLAVLELHLKPGQLQKIEIH